MANKDPAVLFYTSDFLSGAALMTMKERGQYITLLCLQRERGHMSMKEMEKAAGKLSDEVKGKFIRDDGGLFYNQRMEKEIRKREDHRRKQKENIMKRWKKPDGGGGTPFGNTMVYTTVLPLGNGNGNGNGNIYPPPPPSYPPDPCAVGSQAETTPPVVPPTGDAAVLAYYLDRVNPMASQSSLDELRGYAQAMGEGVCKRAIDEALDAKAATWPYIRGILRDKQARGVKSLADWEALERQRESKKQTRQAAKNAGSGNVFQDMLDERRGKW